MKLLMVLVSVHLLLKISNRCVQGIIKGATYRSYRDSGHVLTDHPKLARIFVLASRLKK